MNGNRLLLVFLFVCLIPCVQADVSVNLTVDEKGTVISFYEKYFVVNTKGTIEIQNPSSNDINSLSIPMHFHELYMNLSDVEGIRYRKGALDIENLMANTSKTVRYSIVGITSYKDLVDDDTVFEGALDRSDIRLNTRSVGTLKKAPIEDPAKGGEANERLISVDYRNPTEFAFSINSIKVVKTSGMDVSNELESWQFDKESGEIRPGEVWNIDFIDDDAHEGEVYWLTVDLKLRSFMMQAHGNLTYLTQDELFRIQDNRTNATENVSMGGPLLKERVFLRKKISQSIVNMGQTIEVVLLANNFAPTDIRDAWMKDPVPEGFKVTDARQGSVRDGAVRWDNVTLNGRETRRMSYELTYVENESVGLDYFEPAMLRYENKTVYSRAKPFVRSYVPEKKLFVQKSLEFLSDDEVKVSISLQNMGETELKDIVVSDFLASDYEFKEVTRPFAKKGKWDIDRLGRLEQWEVTYVTNTMGALNTFPNIYGVDERSVLKTVLLSNVIETSYQSPTMRGIEIIGVIIVLVGGIVFFMPKPALLRMLPKRKGPFTQAQQDPLESVLDGDTGKEVTPPEPQPAKPKQAPPKTEERKKEREKRSQYLEEAGQDLNKLKKDTENK